VNSLCFPLKNENGFVLITAMIMLVILTLIGTFALNTTTFELQISGNDRVAKDTFYQADGGTEAAIELVEQNFSCDVGFKTLGISKADKDPATFGSIAGVDVFETRFVMSEQPKDVAGAAAGAKITDPDFPSDTIRSIRIPGDPATRDDVAPHTNIAVYSVPKRVAGGPQGMAEGSSGPGFGQAHGGLERLVHIVSAHTGKNNALSKIHLQWHHMIGQRGDCIY